MENAFLKPDTDIPTMRGLLEAWRPSTADVMQLLNQNLAPIPRLILTHRLNQLSQSDDPNIIGIILHCLREASSLQVADNLGMEISSLVSRVLESKQRGPDVTQAISGIARLLPLLCEGSKAIFHECMRTHQLLPEGLMTTLLSDKPLTPRELTSSPQQGLILLGDYAGLRLRQFNLAKKLFSLAGKEGMSRWMLCRLVVDGKVDYQAGEQVFKRSMADLAEVCDDVRKLQEVIKRKRSTLTTEGLVEWADNLIFACKLRSLKSLALVYSTLPVDKVLSKSGLASVDELQAVIEWSKSSDQAISLSLDGSDVARFCG